MNRIPTKQQSIGTLPLSLGGELPEVSLAYVTYGELNRQGDNAVLVTHGLTSGHGMLHTTGGSEGSWADLLLPGRALDASKYFVVCSNMLGSSYGSTGPTSPRPGIGQPWGADFPHLTISDIVLAQKRLLEHLGVTHLVAVAGPSYGGMQALQWALDHSDWVSSVASVVSGIHWPRGADSADLSRRFEQDPEWQQGRYVVGRDMRGSMRSLRLDTLKSYGVERLLEARAKLKDGVDPQSLLERAAAEWAEVFDPHSLLTLQRAGERFDVSSKLRDIRCPVLFAPSSSDQIFPPDPLVRSQLHEALGDRLIWREIVTPYGHMASGIEFAQWEPDLKHLLQIATGSSEAHE